MHRAPGGPRRDVARASLVASFVAAVSALSCGSQGSAGPVTNGVTARPRVETAPSPPSPEPGPAVVALAPGDDSSEVAPTGPEIRLEVGPPVRELLTPFDRDAYIGSAVGEVLERARQASAALCRHRNEGAPLDAEAVAAFVRDPETFVRASRVSKWPLIAGCWNYVRMNDRKPHRDFELVHALYASKTGYDCQAVGVMQPYLMSEILSCRSLTMLDFDWQIQAIHWQLLQEWAAGGLVPERLDESLARIRIDWIAHHRPQESHETRIPTLCQTSMWDRCRQTLAAFDGRRDDDSLERITLRLAGLHALSLRSPAIDNPLPVIFLSNATEKHFLTRDEFDALLQRTADGLQEGQQAVFIHHVATDSTFGIYELAKTAEGTELRARCRDPYVHNRGTDRAEPYETWFEAALRGASGRPKPAPPTCELLQQRQRWRSRIASEP